MKLRYLLPLFFMIGGCQQSGSVEKFQAEVEDRVRNQLRDPQSAQFKDHYLYPESDVACGSVNSKNGFGGYEGFHYYAYANGSVYFADSDAAEFTRVSAHCSKLEVASHQAEREERRAAREARKARRE